MDRRTGERAAIALALATLGWTAGCVGHARIGPDDGRAWQEVRTERFVLVTDLEAKAAVAHASQLEELAAAFRELYPVQSRRERRAAPLRVVQFADCGDLRQVLAPRAGIPPMDVQIDVEYEGVDFEGDWTMVSCDPARSTRMFLLARLTRATNDRHLAQLPAWLDEGLALYYASLRLGHGSAEVGASSAVDTETLARTDLPPVRDLIAMDPEQFARLGARVGGAAAWKLTHLLDTSDAYRPRFRAMLGELAAGKDPDDAIARALGDVLPSIQREYAAHPGGPVEVWKRPYRPQAYRGPSARRRLDPGEVHALWIEIGVKESNQAEVRRRLDGLDRAHPDWPGRLFWRAVAGRRFDSVGGDPVALLRQYVERVPGDVRGWLGLVTLQLERAMAQGRDCRVPGAAPALDRMEADARQLRRLATRANDLHALAVYHACRRQPDLALAFALRAVDADPSCAACVENLGRLHHELGHQDLASAARRRAVRLKSRKPATPTAGLRAGGA